MARIVTYSAVLTGITAMLVLGGIVNGGSFLSAIGFSNLANGTTSVLAVAVYAIFALSLAGIAVSFFTKQSSESYIVAGLSGTLLTMGLVDIISIFNVMSLNCSSLSGCYWMAGIIQWFAAVLFATYCVSMVQWWRGNDI